MHKVHLLCLLARGRVIDKACNDPLIQVHYIGIHLDQFKLLMFQNDEIPRFFYLFYANVGDWRYLSSKVLSRGIFQAKPCLF